jgi:hypothetical protein
VVVRPSTSPLGTPIMFARIRESVAILAAPAVLFLALAWHRPTGLHMTPLLTLAANAFAHVFFWPPALSAEVVARRINLSVLKRLSLVFAFSMVLPAICMALLHAFHADDPPYGWYGAIDELVGQAVATTLSYVLFRFISTREPRIDLLRRP